MSKFFRLHNRMINKDQLKHVRVYLEKDDFEIVMDLHFNDDSLDAKSRRERRDLQLIDFIGLRGWDKFAKFGDEAAVVFMTTILGKTVEFLDNKSWSSEGPSDLRSQLMQMAEGRLCAFLEELDKCDPP